MSKIIIISLGIFLNPHDQVPLIIGFHFRLIKSLDSAWIPDYRKILRICRGPWAARNEDKRFRVCTQHENGIISFFLFQNIHQYGTDFSNMNYRSSKLKEFRVLFFNPHQNSLLQQKSFLSV